MENLESVIFDMDGTIFNTELLYPQVTEEMLSRRKLKRTQELTDAMMGRPAHVAFQVLIDWHQLPDSIEQLGTESSEIFAELLTQHLDLMPGFTQLFDRIREKGHPLAVCTSASRATALELLAQFEILEHLDFVIGGDEVVRGKPHPEIYLTAAKRMQVSPHRIAVFEDSATGCKAAVDAGTFAVAVPGDHSRTHQFTGAKYIANTLADPRIYELLDLPQ